MKISKWSKGIQEYKEELLEFLAENKLEATEKNMLNGNVNCFTTQPYCEGAEMVTQ